MPPYDLNGRIRCPDSPGTPEKTGQLLLAGSDNACPQEYACGMSATMYRHTQIGTLIVWAVGAPIVLALAIGTFVHPLVFLVSGVLAAFLFLFHSLTVEVTQSLLVVRFGPGLIRRSFPVESVREARTVKNHWYYGWGIRLTPHGWLFNVSGFDAVEIRLENGRHYRIGTDRPEELLAAIQMACRSAGVSIS